MLLEDVPPTMKTVCNLFIHLIDACMHQNLVNERTPHMLQRKRASELTIFGASMIYFFAWSTLQIRFDGSLSPRPIWLSPDPLVSGSYWHAMPVMFTLIIPPVSWLLLLLLLLAVCLFCFLLVGEHSRLAATSLFFLRCWVSLARL